MAESQTLLPTFEESLDAHDVTWSRTTSDRFEGDLSGAIEEPAVGAPLPFEGVSLPEEVVVPPTPDQLKEARTGVTAAGIAIAEYGTLVIQSTPGGDEPVSLYPPRHVAVVRESDLVSGVPEAVEWLAGEFDAGRRSAILATGASATADMGELVRGVHGPGEVHVITITDL